MSRCLVCAHVKQGKLEHRARLCIFLGYLKRINGYKFWSIEDGRVKMLISHDVTFREMKMYKSTIKSNPKDTEGAIGIEILEFEVEANYYVPSEKKPLEETTPPKT